MTSPSSYRNRSAIIRPLRREVRRVAAGARCERGDVVRQQSLQVRRAVRARDDDASAIGAIDERGAAARRVVAAPRGGRNDGAMLRHALLPFYPRLRLAVAVVWPLAAHAQPPATSRVPDAGPRRASRSSCAACRSAPSRLAVTRRATAGPSRAPAASARRSTSSRGGSQVRYTADWKPLEFTFDGTCAASRRAIHTTVEGTTATSDITVGSQSSAEDATRSIRMRC